MNEADKVLNALGNEDGFVTFSENLYTNSEQANKIRGITRLQILRGVTKNYVNFKEKHSRNINNDPEILKHNLNTEKKRDINMNKSASFRVKNLGSRLYARKTNLAVSNVGLDKKGNLNNMNIKGGNQEDPNGDKNIQTILQGNKCSSTNKLYKIYADEYEKILVN